LYMFLKLIFSQITQYCCCNITENTSIVLVTMNLTADVLLPMLHICNVT